jgi:hypothetical protein
MSAAQNLRDACVTAAALCEMILRQGLWPDTDPESLAEFRAAVESTREKCLRAIRRFDDVVDEYGG